MIRKADKLGEECKQETIMQRNASLHDATTAKNIMMGAKFPEISVHGTLLKKDSKPNSSVAQNGTFYFIVGRARVSSVSRSECWDSRPRTFPFTLLAVTKYVPQVEGNAYRLPGPKRYDTCTGEVIIHGHKSRL